MQIVRVASDRVVFWNYLTPPNMKSSHTPTLNLRQYGALSYFSISLSFKIHVNVRRKTPVSL